MNLKRLLKGCFTVLFMFVLTITILIFMINVIFKRNRQPEVNFRELYLEDTIPLAQRTAKKYGLFPSVMIAQSILESNWGGRNFQQSTTIILVSRLLYQIIV